MTYVATCAPYDGQGCRATLYGANGATTLATFESSYATPATKTWTSAGSGQRYLRVRANYGDAYLGAYEIAVEAQ